MIIQLLDGTEIDIEKYSLKRLYHHIPSVTLTHSTAAVDGRDGSLFLDSNFSERMISVELLYEAYDIYDYYSIRDEVNGLFARKESFYIIFKNEPYKRWKVRLASSFQVTPNQHMESFTVDFICVNVFAESIATTLDAKLWDIDKWGWNHSITWDDDLAYRFDSNEFTVKNLGNVPINPRQDELEIVIKATASSYLEIKNDTTGDVYRYNGALTSNDTLTLKGIQSFKNGASVFKETNKKLLTLNVGDNSFTITGGTVISAAFNFGFLYL